MYIIDVIPITRGFGREVISYYGARAYSLGSIVDVPFRNAKIQALVIDAGDARTSKTELRKAGFMLKKIESANPRFLIPEGLVYGASATARFFLTTTGAVLSHIIPKAILANPETSPHTPKSSSKPKSLAATSRGIEAPARLRELEYHELIAEELQHGGSVALFAPTVAAVRKLSQTLSTSFPGQLFSFHSQMSAKKIRLAWKSTVANLKPVLIIATPLFLLLPRRDLKMFIIEQESSPAYITHGARPIDLRHLVTECAAHTGAKLVVGDALLRLQTAYKLENVTRNKNKIVGGVPSKYPPVSIIDMRPYGKSQGGKFSLLSKELISAIEKNLKRHERVVLFAARRGLSPVVVCGDCGQGVLCLTCRAPVVLYGKSHQSAENYFKCHRCDSARSAMERCAHCDSWKLVPLGVGTEGVETELKKKFASAEIFRLDGEGARTPATARKITSNFESVSSGILVGTEMIFEYLSKPAALVGIVSMDALFSIPDFRIHEKIMRIVLQLHERATGKFFMQTRYPDEEVIQNAASGRLDIFRQRELSFRKKFSYPPFSVIISVRARGRFAGILTIDRLRKALSPFDLLLIERGETSLRGGRTPLGVLKIPCDDWPNAHLETALAAFTKDFIFEINPAL